jgi:hypothetical protein
MTPTRPLAAHMIRCSGALALVLMVAARSSPLVASPATSTNPYVADGLDQTPRGFRAGKLQAPLHLRVGSKTRRHA